MDKEHTHKEQDVYAILARIELRLDVMEELRKMNLKLDQLLSGKTDESRVEAASEEIIQSGNKLNEAVKKATPQSE